MADEEKNGLEGIVEATERNMEERIRDFGELLKDIESLDEGVGQSPTLGQLRSLGSGLIAHDQRDAGVAQGVEAGGDRQLRDPVESAYAFGGNSELLFQIESASTARQLDDVRDAADGFEGGVSVIALYQAGNVFVEHGAPEARGNRIDELIAAQDAGDVAIIENVIGSGQA